MHTYSISMETRQRKRHRGAQLTTASGKPVSAIGLGGNGWQEQPSSLPPNALALGINHFFCYSARPKCEETYAPHPSYMDGLQRVSTKATRDDVFLVGASRGRNATRLSADLELLCEQGFGSDRIDCFVLAFVGGEEGDDNMAHINALLEILQDWKRQGKIRYVGASTHGFDIAVKLASSGLCDYLMCRYNMAHTRMEASAFPVALQHYTTVVAFTTTRWNTLQGGTIPGHSAPSTGDCVAFARSHPAVKYVLNSCRTDEELQEVIRVGTRSMDTCEVTKWNKYGKAFYKAEKGKASPFEIGTGR